MFLNLGKSLVPYATHVVPYATHVVPYATHVSIRHSPRNVLWVMDGMNFNLVPGGKYIDRITNQNKYQP